MSFDRVLKLRPATVKKMPKQTLVKTFLKFRTSVAEKMERQSALIKEQTETINRLRQEQEEAKTKAVNQTTNEPTSKKPEFDKDGNPKPKKKKRKKKRKKQPGSGNESKADLIPDETNHIPCDECPKCGGDLSKNEGTEKPPRIVEDIAPPPEKTVVSEEIEETKWCPDCQVMVSSKTERALPGSDIGLNAVILMAYFWITCALSLPSIQRYFRSLKALKVSTAGISKIMIRLSNILQPVYDEILTDVKVGTKIWADETGWRVKGKTWWLWVFANERSAYYWPDRCRGGPVVEAILGTIFLGVVIVDGWQAYNKISCAKQTCMAHIFRKIRGFIEAYPQYRSIMAFYVKLRRIIKDGEKLKEKRDTLGEVVFHRRLQALKQRLDKLLKWEKPNPVLKDVIKKVRRQQDKILTFVEHDGVTSHNNYGEYIIKKGVLKRKISGGSMSEAGVKAYGCLQSIAMTCQLRNISFYSFMHASLVRYIRTGRPMLLSEYEAETNETRRAA